MTSAWPTEIRLTRDRRALDVAFDDARRARLPAELLRCESPSAEVQGHGAHERRLVPAKRDVAITSIEPIGNYAVRIVYDDGHSTGIYGWNLLWELAHDPQTRLSRYRNELREAGLTHEPGRDELGGRSRP